MPKCIRCKLNFETTDELLKHMALEHSSERKTEEIELFPLFNNIVFVTFIAAISIIGITYFSHHPWSNALIIIEASYVPMIFLLTEQWYAKRKYRCPKCNSPLNSRIKENGKTYQCCSDDSCPVSEYELYLYQVSDRKPKKNTS